MMKKNEKEKSRWYTVALFILMTVMVGAKLAYDNKEEIKRLWKEWTKDNDDDEIEKAQQHTFAAYQEKLKPITPWLISQLILAEGVTMNNNGMHIPYKDSEGIWTIGFGNTRLKDGSKVTKDTPPITTDEAYDLARWHLEEHETFFDLYCYSVIDERLVVRNTGEAFGLASIVYNSGTKFIENESDDNHRNRFLLLRKEYKEYGAAIPDSVVIKSFEKYPIRNKAAFGKAWIDSNAPQDMAKAIGLYMRNGNGMHWRRWLEAGLITGDINPEDLLECPIKGIYDFYLYMGGYKQYKGAKGESKATIEKKDTELKKSALWEKTSDGWIPRKSTYTDFKEWLKNPKTKEKGTGKEFLVTRKKVRDYLPKYVVQECMNGMCEIGAPAQKRKTEEVEKEKQIETKTYVMGYEDLYQSALDNYRRGNYDVAIQIVESLVAANPNNALLHNDLALFYNKIGEYDKAIEHARKIVREIGDKSQYGAAQYNAGVAYEHKGDLERALKNYQLALSNGNGAAHGAIERIKKKMAKTKTKTTAFNDGIRRMQQKYNGANIIYSSDKEYQA